jgi:GMP synthase (glutamine-hydrolysing)
MKPVLCVRNDRDDTLGITRRLLAESGMPIVQLDAFASGISWPAREDISGLIVFGGEMNADAIASYPYLSVLRQLIRDTVSAGKPLLGICLGAQLLARALGAAVYRAPVREFGFTPVRLTQAGRHDRLLASFDERPCVFQWHEDTFDLPAGAQLLAVGDAVTNQAFRYGAAAWGIQFHFEVDEEGVKAWLRAAEAQLMSVWHRSADEIREELQLHLERQQQQAAVLFRAFAELFSR